MLGDQQPRGARDEGQAVRVAQAAGLDAQIAAVGPEGHHRSRQRLRGAARVELAAHAEVDPPVRSQGQRVDPVAAGRQTVDDHALLREPAPVEAREGDHPTGVARRRHRRVRDDVAHVQLAVVPQQPERAEQPPHHVARPRAAARDHPDAVGPRREMARGRHPQPPAAVEGEVRRMRDPAREPLHLHARRHLHRRLRRAGNRQREEDEGGGAEPARAFSGHRARGGAAPDTACARRCGPPPGARRRASPARPRPWPARGPRRPRPDSGRRTRRSTRCPSG